MIEVGGSYTGLLAYENPGIRPTSDPIMATMKKEVDLFQK